MQYTLFDKFNMQVTTPMPMMLWVAAIVEGVIENYVDMGILLGIQVLLKSEQHETKSK